MGNRRMLSFPNMQTSLFLGMPLSPFSSLLLPYRLSLHVFLIKKSATEIKEKNKKKKRMNLANLCIWFSTFILRCIYTKSSIHLGYVAGFSVHQKRHPSCSHQISEYPSTWYTPEMSTFHSLKCQDNVDPR